MLHDMDVMSHAGWMRQHHPQELVDQRPRLLDYSKNRIGLSWGTKSKNQHWLLLGFSWIAHWFSHFGGTGGRWVPGIRGAVSPV